MKLIEIRHCTRYEFGKPVQLGPHTLRVRPREGHDLGIVSSALTIVPKAIVTWRRDLYDNVPGIAAFGQQPATQLEIESKVEVELYDTMPLDFVVEDHALRFPFEYRSEERIALDPYLKPAYPDDGRIARWLDPYRTPQKGTETFSILDSMNRRINEGLDYEVREQEGVLTPAETLRIGTGSCRDFAALFLELTSSYLDISSRGCSVAFPPRKLISKMRLNSSARIQRKTCARTRRVSQCRMGCRSTKCFRSSNSASTSLRSL
jgi:transglutaminase-like putative cysteine protease